MRVVAIIQARMSSERLPGKVLKTLNGVPMIQCIVNRASKAKRIDDVIVATSNETTDDMLYNFCIQNDINVYRGDLNNVLKRYYDCATREKADIIIRLTGDNALIDAEIIDASVEVFEKQDVDYLRYCEELPIGMHIEVFSYQALKQAMDEVDNSECKEHVTLYMYKNIDKFRCITYSEKEMTNHSTLRWTMDTSEDYELVSKIYQSFRTIAFTYQDILDLYERKPELKLINENIKQKKIKYKSIGE